MFYQTDIPSPFSVHFFHEIGVIKESYAFYVACPGRRDSAPKDFTADLQYESFKVISRHLIVGIVYSKEHKKFQLKRNRLLEKCVFINNDKQKLGEREQPHQNANHYFNSFPALFQYPK